MRNRPEVSSVVYELGLLNQISFHGCALGLITKIAAPIIKPWMAAMSCKKLADRFLKYQYPRTGVHITHHPCATNETKRTDGHTDEMAEAIHATHHKEASNLCAKMA